MKAAELTGLRYRELEDRLAETKEEYFNLRFQMATNQLDNTARLRDLRRDIARINTVMRAQEIDAYYREVKDEA
ncbi:MAG: 50S ribosomal protein L29 [Acidimicrobiia bacterium]|nr:50S ribosomal protein L29 [Acidimicrobiia bacterium]